MRTCLNCGKATKNLTRVCSECANGSTKAGSQNQGAAVPRKEQIVGTNGHRVKRFDRAAYHRAVSRAKHELSKEFPDRFRQILDEELER